MKITISNYLYIKKLNISTIEQVFIKYGGLYKGCFEVCETRFSDGSQAIEFNYPTDMNVEQAHEFVDKVCIATKDVKLCDLPDSE